jgi:hypothetical protein
MKCQIKNDWYDAGKTGVVLSELPNTDHAGIQWTPVLWDDDEDPTFHKTRGLQFYTDDPKPPESGAMDPVERVRSILENVAPVSDAFRLEEIAKVVRYEE